MHNKTGDFFSLSEEFDIVLFENYSTITIDKIQPKTFLKYC